MTEQSTLQDAAAPSESRWAVIQPWITLVVRVAIAVILIVAAIPKFADLNQSVRAVRAYQLLPPDTIAPFVGVTLPFLEVIVAAILLAGVFTRFGAIVWIVMMTGFLIGVIWVWVKGYSIDCGCFGGGGEVDPGETNYPLHLMERIGFIAMGLFVAVFPRSALSVDAWMRGDSISGRPSGEIEE